MPQDMRDVVFWNGSWKEELILYRIYNDTTRVCKATEFHPLDLGRSLWMWIQSQTPPTPGRCLRSTLLKIFYQSVVWRPQQVKCVSLPSVGRDARKVSPDPSKNFDSPEFLRSPLLTSKFFEDFCFLYRLIPNGWYNSNIMDGPHLMRHRPPQNIGRWQEKLKSTDRSPCCALKSRLWD